MPRKKAVAAAGDKYVIESPERLKEKLALKGNPFKKATLARSVEAGTITLAQAVKHDPDFKAYVERRTELGLPITATGKEVAQAKPKEDKPKAQRAAAKTEGKTTSTVRVTKTDLKRMTKAQMADLIEALQ